MHNNIYREEKLQKFAKLKRSFQYEQNYCGCCGIEIAQWAEWCFKCYPHIDTLTHKAPWDKTYFALNGRDCPFQIGKKENG